MECLVCGFVNFDICVNGRSERIPEEDGGLTMSKTEKIRKFKTGATRDVEVGKLDYEGFLSPIVLKAFAEYMNKHRVQTDGEVRDSDNWQKGIPKSSYMKSLFRHFMDLWMEHRGYESRDGIKDALYGIIFNSMGYLFELLKEEGVGKKQAATYRQVTRMWLLLYRQIHSRGRQGKAFEQMTAHAMEKLERKGRFWFMRIFDYQSFIYLNPRFYAPKQPADFMACCEGRFYFVECKSSQQPRFPVDIFKPHQFEAMKKMFEVGGKYWLLILKRAPEKKDQVIYAYDYQAFMQLKKCMEQNSQATATWEQMWQYARFTFKREAGGWNLEVLFNE
jgi:penicillin-binding protein-related factor A (putative recombinase)